ncbi:phage tail protein, partial [Salmonella enterica subsp. enterica serovar Anatum]|nr:phage tail protein [Salmonella enterica subsp. enterica serovar Anatum]
MNTLTVAPNNPNWLIAELVLPEEVGGWYVREVGASTTALVNGEAIDHAAQLSRELPALGVGIHFVLTLGKPVSEMP